MEIRIKPRIKRNWLFRKIKVYDLIGYYDNLQKQELIETFKTFEEAETFKTELELWK